MKEEMKKRMEFEEEFEEEVEEEKEEGMTRIKNTHFIPRSLSFNFNLNTWPVRDEYLVHAFYRTLWGQINSENVVHELEEEKL